MDTFQFAADFAFVACEPRHPIVLDFDLNAVVGYRSVELERVSDMERNVGVGVRRACDPRDCEVVCQRTHPGDPQDITFGSPLLAVHYRRAGRHHENQLPVCSLMQGYERTSFQGGLGLLLSLSNCTRTAEPPLEPLLTDRR